MTGVSQKHRAGQASQPIQLARLVPGRTLTEEKIETVIRELERMSRTNRAWGINPSLLDYPSKSRKQRRKYSPHWTARLTPEERKAVGVRLQAGRAAKLNQFSTSANGSGEDRSTGDALPSGGPQ